MPSLKIHTHTYVQSQNSPKPRKPLQNTSSSEQQKRHHPLGGNAHVQHGHFSDLQRAAQPSLWMMCTSRWHILPFGFEGHSTKLLQVKWLVFSHLLPSLPPPWPPFSPPPPSPRPRSLTCHEKLPDTTRFLKPSDTAAGGDQVANAIHRQAWACLFVCGKVEKQVKHCDGPQITGGWWSALVGSQHFGDPPGSGKKDKKRDWWYPFRLV